MGRTGTLAPCMARLHQTTERFVPARPHSGLDAAFRYYQLQPPAPQGPRATGMRNQADLVYPGARIATESATAFRAREGGCSQRVGIRRGSIARSPRRVRRSDRRSHRYPAHPKTRRRAPPIGLRSWPRGSSQKTPGRRDARAISQAADPTRALYEVMESATRNMRNRRRVMVK